jgi:CheY-like chemotaxis protein
LDDERLLADVLGSSSSGSKPGSTFSSQSQIDGLTAGSLVPMGAAGGASSAVVKGSTLRGAGGGRPQLKPTGGEDFVDDVLDDVLVGATGAPHSTERTLAARQHAPGFPASDSSHRRRYLTVLIVDDSELTRKMMRRVLEAAGHICDEAEDGIDAISKFKMSFALDRRYHPQHARRTVNLIKRSSTGSVSASFTTTGGIHGGTLRHSFTAQLSSIQEALEGEASPECSANDDSGAVFGSAGLDNSNPKLQLHSCYDVILMDFVMPNMDGPTATKELRRLGYEGLILGVTGNALPTDIDHFLAHGASKVLLKPFRIKEFNEAVSVEAARGNQGTNGSGGISTPSPLSTPTMQLA